MPKGEIYKRRELSNWIKEIRERSGMKVASFGNAHIRFLEKNGKMSAVSYKRVAVSYWEAGEHLPSYPETIASLAIMDYDLRNPLQNLESISNSSARMKHVTSCMEKYLGRKLYCKNFTDLLILHAARGMFPLTQVPEIYNEFMEIILQDSGNFTETQRKSFLMRRDTNTLFARLLELKTLEELKAEVRENSHFYAVGYRMLGERLQAIYQKSYEIINQEMDLLSAVRFYAPVYRDSVKKLTSYEIVVSRRWLIDLCLLLHFSRKDINEVLRNAQYIELSEELDHPESLLQELPDKISGSAEWFGEVERNFLRIFKPVNTSLPVILEDTDFSPLRFFRLQEYTEKEKLFYVLSVGCCILESGESFPLPLYELDYLLAKPEMKKALKAMLECNLKEFQENGRQWIIKTFYRAIDSSKADTIDAADEWNPVYLLLKKYHAQMEQHIEHPKWYHHGKTMQELRLTLIDDYAAYYEVSEEKIALLKENAQTLGIGSQQYEQILWDFACGSYFSAFCYTVFTGFLYKGTVYQDELHFMRKEEGNALYSMLRFCFMLYLGESPVSIGPNGGILLEAGDTREMNFPRVLLQLLSYLN